MPSGAAGGASRWRSVRAFGAAPSIASELTVPEWTSRPTCRYVLIRPRLLSVAAAIVAAGDARRALMASVTHRRLHGCEDEDAKSDRASDQIETGYGDSTVRP
jgi:hypothetical protein